ncbi:hypothetical protein BGZ72_009507 [Mortierella alpina]|nr:hypothetical protein BGZ72_009507 [Mortierella alpina]
MASFGSPITRDGTGTVRRREITLTTREKQIYGQLWAAADKDNSGFITGADAVPFFAKSGLPPQVLGQIWVLADSDNKGVLGQQGFSIAVKLIAHAQNGKTPSAALINVDAPLPHFDGITPAKTGDTSQTPIAAQLTGSGSASGAEPPLTNDDRTKYGGMFVACGPVNGLLDGDKAREVFLKSKLPVEKLSQIWSLADTKQRGSLDITDFTIAMYYIQHTMDGSIASLPATLPASILKACSVAGGGVSGAGLISSPVMGSQSLPRQLTGGNLNVHSSPGFVGRQLTGSLGMTSSPLAKQNTGGAGSSSNLFGASDSVPWDISPEEKAKFDRFFDQLDKTGAGVIGGEEASRFFMNSRLPESVLAQIWDLSDITGSGNLSKDEFAVAMLLINRKNATNAPIPKTLPLSLVPPSLRNRVATTGAFAGQEPSRSLTMPSSQSQYRRQSFDLLGDGPSLTSSIHAAGASTSSQVDKDLMGAEDLTSKLTSETGELASMQNQINNLSQVTGDLQAKRAVLERQLSLLSAQKQDISIRLNQIKTLHEGETKAIRDLESTLSSIQPQLIKLREEYAVSERELNIARSNKDEFMLTLAKDQEESNMIRARLRQNNEETIKLREELEAKKKDTGRQKGLLEIARRQLSASDADKQKIVNEIAQESEKAAQAAKEIQAMSSLSPASASSLAPSGPPPPPAPRGSRKEPPPPPASRGTGIASPSSPFASRVSPEAEEAFGIPPALRSPTGSFHSVHSPRAPQSLSRQSTGSSPFETIPRQTTGSSPFQSISRQATGSSFSGAALEPIAQQGTGMSTKSTEHNNAFLTAPASGAAALQENLWSPSTHAAHATMSGQPELTASPFPETPQVPAESQTDAAAESFTTSPPAVSEDPFGSMAFPAMDTPPVTKMDFDSAFTGFAPSSSSKPPLSKNNSAVGSDGVKSAEAFAEAFPDIDGVGDGTDGTKAKRVSAFGFDDDFSAASPFTQTLEKSKEVEEDEFPPIVEMNHPDEDSSEEEEDDDDDDAFVQATSSVTSPDPAAPAASQVEASAPVETSQAEDSTALPEVAGAEGTLAPATTAPPVSTGSVTKKLTAADFGEFEAAFGGSGDGDDFDSAFNGVELAAPKVSSGTGGFGVSGGGFDEGFDFNSSFDDAFGPPAATPASAAATGASNPTDAFGASFSAPFPSATAATRQESFGEMEFNTSGKPVVARQATALDLDEAFGGFGGSAATPATGTEAAASTNNGFGGFGDFEAEFSSLSTSSAAPAASTTAGVTDATSGNGPAAAAAAAAATTPAPPQVDLPGVDELISMGFTRQQANDALSRYDTVERAANFLLEGGQ